MAKVAPPLRTPVFTQAFLTFLASVGQRLGLQVPSSSTAFNEVWVRWLVGLGSGTIGTQTIVDNEVPAGVIDGANRVFTLTNSPNPPESAKLYKNGQKLRLGVGFTLVDNTITYAAGYQPQPASGGSPADTHEVDYRYT